MSRPPGAPDSPGAEPIEILGKTFFVPCAERAFADCSESILRRAAAVQGREISRPPALGFLPRAPRKLDATELYEEVARVLDDCEELLRELRRRTDARLGLVEKIARTVQEELQAKTTHLVALENERRALGEEARRHDDRALSDRVAAQGDRLLAAVRGLAWAALLALRKLELATAAMTALMKDLRSRSDPLAELRGRFDRDRRAFALERRIGGLERAAPDLERAAPPLEAVVREAIAPLDSLQDEAKHADGVFHGLLRQVREATERLRAASAASLLPGGEVHPVALPVGLKLDRGAPCVTPAPTDDDEEDVAFDVALAVSDGELVDVAVGRILALTRERVAALDDRLPAAPTGIRPASSSVVARALAHGFVRLPAGAFLMGSNDGGFDERPAHTVTLTRPFDVLGAPVTQELYEALAGENPSRFRGRDLPVENVSWFAAVAFCNRLSMAAGLTPAYEIRGDIVRWAGAEAAGFRLLSEAEWEYACRAGTGPERSGELDRIAWSAANSGGRTQPVATREANAWGLYDMLGNVWEWCADWYGDYQGVAQINPAGPSAGARRVARGGSWATGAGGIGAAIRACAAPGDCCHDRGFRVGRDASGEALECA
ncbi:MAG: SUMF1/EgtB/PvdO family nonheme iron enzyme [Candidatus Schekmanbacteria bacterium]|nr:SUMF1/EgtB/PvdO family nonheme iron enzyme [Candidatus Schekmanbacteria bacterium]